MGPQSCIAHFRITAKLGEGGMGVVYRATDTKLSRDVAIKVLPATFAHDPGRMTRFQREAQVLASLNHPNIAAIYGVEEHALVMELVEGPTLGERIARGAMPVEEVLPIARQIAEALEYAHERGIVHRDLKPANIKITSEGRVKVLDFGLAKAMSSDAEPSDSMAPTLTMHDTLAGAIMGTAAYMSPEQARGQPVDKRSDIWAFGVVLYEMLRGRRLFTGTTTSDTLASVLKTEPDLATVPVRFRPIVERCLRKDPRQRWRDIGDVRVALEEGVSTAPVAESRRTVLPWIVAVGFAIATIISDALWAPWRDKRPVSPPLMRFSVDLGPDALLGSTHTAAISPDGTRLVFPSRGPDGKQHLATRLLEQTQATVLAGTENGRDPIFSPDGREIGFYSSGSWKKVPVQGGVPVTLGGAIFAYGATLGEDGSIILSSARSSPLYRVPAPGAAAKRITDVTNGETTHDWPQMLPGGQVLFTASATNTNRETSNIEVVSFKTGEKKTLLRGGYYGRYLPSGHLVYMHQGVLYGVAFNVDRLEVHGDRVALLEDVACLPSAGSAQFDFSTTGTLVYAAVKTPQTWPIVWLDSSGNTQPLLSTPGVYSSPRFSPNGRQLAVHANTSGTSYLSVFDLQRGNISPLTATVDANSGPVWAPDGKHIAFGTASQSGYRLFWARSDGAGDVERLLENPEQVVPWSFSPNGKQLACMFFHPERQADIWTLPLDTSDTDHPKAGNPELFLGTAAQEVGPQFSHDGRWIAYRSNATGTYEIYVRPFPARPGNGWQISDGGGIYGLWSNNNRELFYETADNRIMVVEYSVDGDSFIPGKRRLWSDRRLLYAGTMNLALHPDGKHFAVFESPKTPDSERNSVHVTFLLNFFDYLRRRIPTGK